MSCSPKFIVFEGIDGAGKSTQSIRLFNFISGLNIPVKKLAEPTDGLWGRHIRVLLKSDKPPAQRELIEIFIKDRADDLEHNIRPCIDGGITIVMDRYLYSNAAYQGSGTIPPVKIISMNHEMGFPLPDRVYFIDLPAEEAMKRIISRNSSSRPELFEKETFLKKVRDNFLSIADDRFVIINGLQPEDEIFSIVKDDYLKLIS